MAQSAPSDAVKALAPSGHIRFAINFGNPILVQKGPTVPEANGISPALARALAGKLGVPFEFIPFDTAGKVSDAVGTWDVAFLAVDPVRAGSMDFTAPYVIIEGAYAVPEASPVQAVEDVDRPGTTVSVARGSAYDLFLTRALKQASLIRADTGNASEAAFLRDKLDVLAGIRQPLAAFVKSHPGYRLVPGRFMAIEQAMVTPKGRDAGARFLREFVEEMKASGFVARTLAETGQAEATVAPPARNPGK